MPNNNNIPQFKSEDQEREYWSKNSLLDHADKFEQVELDLSKLKPSTESISLRLPAHMLRQIKLLANAKDVPYQSLMKVYLSDRIKKELGSSIHK